MAREEDDDLYDEEFDFVDDDDVDDDEGEPAEDDASDLDDESDLDSDVEAADDRDRDDTNAAVDRDRDRNRDRGDADVDADDRPVDEYGRPAPKADYVVHVYEHSKFKRTIDRPFTPEDAEAFATEYNRTSKSYGRLAVTSKNDVKPKKTLA